MQIKNPTDNSIEVCVMKTTYFIEANGTLNNVPETHARFWQEHLHNFLILRNDDLEKVVVKDPIPKEVTAKVKEPKTETTKEEVKEEVKETPKKKETILEKAKRVVAKKTNLKK